MNLGGIDKLLRSRQKMGVKKRWLVRGTVLLFWIVCLGLFFWFGWKNRGMIIPYLVGANYYHFIGVSFAYLGSLIAAVINWSVIMLDLDGSLSLWKNAQIYSITLASRRLPGTIWYVVGRTAMYQQLGVTKTTVVVASSIELIITLVTGGLVGLILMLTSGTSLPSLVILSIVGGFILGALILHPSILKAILKYIGMNQVENLRIKNILVWFLLCVFMWIMSGLMIGQLVSVFRPITFQETFFIIGIWALSGTAGLLTFFLPSSFGVTELTLTALLSQIMPLPLAGVIAILTRLMTTLFEILLSFAFYPALIHMPLYKQIEKSKEEDGNLK